MTYLPCEKRLDSLEAELDAVDSVVQKNSQPEDLSLCSSDAAKTLETPAHKSTHSSSEDHETVLPPHPMRQTVLGWIIGSSGFCGGVKVSSDLAESLSFNNRDFFICASVGSLVGFVAGMVVTHYLGVWMNQDL